MSEILKNRHLKAHEMANQWPIQKSKPGYLEYPSPHLWTDSWPNQSMLSTLWAATDVSKIGTFVLNGPPDPPSVLHPLKNGTTI